MEVWKLGSLATRTARVGNRRFLRTQRLTETTEDHRGGQRLPHAGRGSESWKLGGLEVWRRFRLSPVGALLHFLYLLNLLKTARAGNRRFRRFLADLGACYRTQDCQNSFTTKNTKNHEGHKELIAGGGPCVRARRTSGPEACRGVAGFARHALGRGAAQPPLVLPRSLPISQSANQQALRQSAYVFAVPISLTTIDCPAVSPVAPQGRSLFSVFCSLGRVSAPPVLWGTSAPLPYYIYIRRSSGGPKRGVFGPP